MSGKYNKTAMSLWMLIIIATISVYQFSCTSKKVEEEVSDEIVLKIGKVEITKYEFEKNKKLFGQTNPKHSPKALKKWLGDYIDKTYMLADAYDRRFDTIKSIIKRVHYTSIDMLSEVDGFVWNKVEKPKLEISDSELKEAYRKRNQLYYIEYLYFPSATLLDSILKNNRNIRNEKDFKNLVQLCKENKRVESKNCSFRWPFEYLVSMHETIARLNAGEVTTPLPFQDGYCILHLIKKEVFKQQLFDKEKKGIEFIMKHMKTEQIIEAKQKEIFGKANIVIDENIVNELIKKIKAKVTKLDSLELNKILMTYTFCGSRKNYLVKDLWEYLNNAPYLEGDYTQSNSLKRYIKEYVISQYLYKEADNLGILKEKKYLLDVKIYQHELLSMCYEYDEFRRHNKDVPDQEVLDYYHKNKASYAGTKIATASVLTFKDQEAARKNYSKVSEMVWQGQFYNLRDTSVIKGLIAYKPNQKIDYNSKDYPANVINGIFSAREKQVSMFCDNDKNYILVFTTKKEGERIKELREVEKQIQGILIENKVSQLKDKRIKELKVKFPIIVNKTAKLI